MKKYDTYKDSGIKWADNIPYDWNVVPLKYKISYEKGKNAALYTKEYLADNFGVIPVYSGQTSNNGIMGFVPNYDYNTEIALLVTTVGAKAMTVNKIEGKFSLSQNCALLLNKSNQTDLKYFYYLLNILFEYEKDLIATIIQPSLRFEDLDKYKIISPSLEEQTAIASFLDYKTNLIDAIIEKKKRLIDLLKEKRQAVINEAVTKGLNPNAPMKESGVEWLGEIPEHWKIKRLRHIGNCQNGVSESGDYFGSGFPFVSYGDVYKNETLPNQVQGLAKSTEEDKIRFSVEKGDVFFTRTSETIEEIGISSTCLQTIENAVFAGFLIKFRPFKNILDPNFSKYYFRSFIPRYYFVKEMNLVTRASLSQDLLKGLPIILPSIEEQLDIAKSLDKNSSIIDKSISKIQTAIDKFQTYRQSLISEAVTGKIDVRACEKAKN